MKKHNSQIFFIYIVLALTLFFPIVHPAYGQEITTEQLQEKGVLLFPLSENEWLMIIRLRELAESHWFLLSASDNQKLGVNISSMIEVADIVASPSGHYLAVSACEASRILQCPSADLWIVIPGSKPDKTGLRVIKASSEAEGLESGIRVENPAAELVEVHPL